MPSEEGVTRKPRRNRRGTGSVYFDQFAKVWIASFSLGTRGGRRIRRKRTAPDERSAQRELVRLQRWYGDAGDVALLTLDAYLADWLDMVRPTVAQSSWEAYRAHVRHHISPLLGGIVVGALRPADVRRLIADRLAAGKSPQTVVSVVSTLKAALGIAVRDGELPRNVATMADMPRVEREPVEAMTPERAQAILDAVAGDRLEAFYVLLLGTGLRAGEACALDWGDVEGGRVRIRGGKTRSARRVIPMPAFVARALAAHRVQAGRVGIHEPVFTGERKHERLRVDQAGRAFPKLLTDAGVPRMTLHKLRHATATLLLQRGIDMRTISEILGHANPALTAKTYAHVSDESKRRAMASLDEVTG